MYTHINYLHVFYKIDAKVDTLEPFHFLDNAKTLGHLNSIYSHFVVIGIFIHKHIKNVGIITVAL